MHPAKVQHLLAEGEGVGAPEAEGEPEVDRARALVVTRRNRSNTGSLSILRVEAFPGNNNVMRIELLLANVVSSRANSQLQFTLSTNNLIGAHL